LSFTESNHYISTPVQTDSGTPEKLQQQAPAFTNFDEIELEGNFHISYQPMIICSL
jgi:hypothetical protein